MATANRTRRSPRPNARLAPFASCAALLAVSTAACSGEHPQSIVHPRGPAAAAIGGLWWFLAALVLSVFVVTMVLLLAALRRSRAETPGAETPADEPPLGSTRFVVTAGLIVPGLVLIGLLFASLGATVALRQPDQAFTTVRIVGHQWWWHVEYPDYGIVTANELHLPVGEVVRLELEANDVVHSLWVPSLAGKMDMLPERRNVFWLAADEAGVYRGQCTEFCGVQHARMALEVVALERPDFDAWVARHRNVPQAPATELARRGEALFFSAGCAACHAVAGTPAAGRLGPDLTHLRHRRTLAAATVANTAAMLARWIRGSIKPGNLMPPSPLADDELAALVAWLLERE